MPASHLCHRVSFQLVLLNFILLICEAKYLLLFAFVLTVYARLASLHYVEDFLS